MGDRQEQQLTLWGELYPYFHIKNKLRLIELFAGVGSQMSAIETLFNKGYHVAVGK